MQIKRNDEMIQLLDDNNVIESYSFEEVINFKALSEYLLKKNLSEKVELDIKIDYPKTDESNLISIIERIIESYNERVAEFNKFMKERGENVTKEQPGNIKTRTV